MTRRFFISADIEGCAAVASQHALASDRWEWPAARRWMTAEVVAVAEAALDCGYDEVIVADGHGNAHNIEPDALPDNVWLIRSWPRPLLQMQGVEQGVEACAFVGYHAAAGAHQSILAHTYHGGAFRSVRLNGELCSEGYLNAALAGEFGAPVVLVAGDQHTIEDARRYAPSAELLVVKRSIGGRSQMALPPRQVCRQLGAATKAALSKPPPAPFIISPPYRLELEMVSPIAMELLSYLPGVETDCSRSIYACFSTLEEVMRFIAFAILYTPNGMISL